MSELIKINRNIVWAKAFIDQIVLMGIEYACISPGSRSTPLAFACANNNKLKSYIHIDERSGGFFGLGLAKSTRKPVLLICTSGTAAAEFYPAVIEAYQQNVPLIVCTADRPPELIGCGANQTINQDNLYANHIRWFFNAGLPEPTPERLRHIRTIARRAVKESAGLVKGPVHINFPFRKPFEPKSYTDTVDPDMLGNAMQGFADDIPPVNVSVTPTPESVKGLVSTIRACGKGMIIVGPGDFPDEFARQLTDMASMLSYPVLADGASQLRFGNHNKKFIFTHYDAYLKIAAWNSAHKPELILQFGSTVSSKGLELFLNEADALKVHINAEGNWMDPSNYLRSVVQSDPVLFCKLMNTELRENKPQRPSETWLKDYQNAEKIAAAIREEIIDCTESLFEGKILKVALESIPDGSHVMISNSMPIRDLDYFISSMQKDIRIHTNRGASGIDGINSTALGIAATQTGPVYLITGDLAFYHDLNGLIASKKYRIPLTIILINNNGGGIFELLPISEYREIFDDFFLTPHNLNFKPFVNGYGGEYININSWNDLRNALRNDSGGNNGLKVYEITTDARASTDLRKKYWMKIEEAIAT